MNVFEFDLIEKVKYTSAMLGIYGDMENRLDMIKLKFKPEESKEQRIKQVKEQVQALKEVHYWLIELWEQYQIYFKHYHRQKAINEGQQKEINELKKKIEQYEQTVSNKGI